MMRVLLTGASGQLGAYVLRSLLASEQTVTAWSGTVSGESLGVTLAPVDLADGAAIDRGLEVADPTVIVHAAAVSTAEGVRLDPERGRLVNVDATDRLAAWSARHGRRIVYTSTDLVFDGSKPWNREGDPASPVLAYGRTKLAGERSILATPGGLVVRLSLLYGPSQSRRESYFDRTVAGLKRGEPQTFFEDEFRTPLDLATAAATLVRLAVSDATGLFHLGGAERLSRFELARRVAGTLGFDPALVRANLQRDVTFPEPRPADVSLDTARLAALLPDLRRPTVEEATAGMWS